MPVAYENGINMVPKSLTLQEELRRALSQEVLSFKGDYYHAQLLWSAPNPCLSISRLGPIGLPLVEDYAKRIISVARLSREQCGMLDIAVHGIWKIDPSQISFLNPTWESYISNTLCREVCTALGASTSAPKMELRRLLLFEGGSGCSAHNIDGLQRTDGIFATVTIFLPSAYSGGETILSSPSNTTTIDFAVDSAYASAVLAVYADTAQEVRPISSGYCLALSYDLIHTTSSTEPCPSPPQTLEAASLLRTVLRKWRDRLDSYETEQYLAAYLLDHTYDLQNVKDVATSLKGVDGYRVRILIDLAEELGFTLGVGSLEYTSGAISDVLKDSTILKQLTGLDGKPLFGLTKPMRVPKDSVIMVTGTTSKGNPSPKSKHGGGPDNGGKRSVILLIDGKHHDDVRFEVEGLPVAVQVLRETSQIPPTRENIKWAKRILQQSKRNKEYTKDTFTEMLNYSMDWEDLELWKQSTDSYLWDFNYVHSDLLFKAYRTFAFDKIRDSFSEIMDNSSLWCDDHIERPAGIIIFLHTLSGEAEKEGGRDAVQSWCQDSVKKVLRKCSPKNPLHAESVLRVIRLVGMQLCWHYLLPDLIDRDDERYFSFWIALNTLLRDQRQSLLEDLSKSHPDPPVPTASNSFDENGRGPKTARSTNDILNDLITMSLCIPSFTWFKEQRPYTNDIASFVFGCPRAKFNPIPGRIDRLVSVIDACVRSSDATLCESALEQSLETSGNPMWYLTEFYTPIIFRVRDILESLGQEITQPPFSNFLRKLIGRCLSQILGKRGPVVDIGLRKLSCKKAEDCATCKKVDAFILSTQPKIQLHMEPKDCCHAEGRLENAIDLCTYERPGESDSDRYRSRFGKQTLEIQKHESVVRCSSWDYRLSVTNAFLESIGPDSLIEDIMGDRYADVQSALTGRRKFVWDEKRDAQPQAAPPGAEAASVGGSPTVFQQDAATADKPPRVFRSQKRKRA